MKTNSWFCSYVDSCSRNALNFSPEKFRAAHRITENLHYLDAIIELFTPNTNEGFIRKRHTHVCFEVRILAIEIFRKVYFAL